LRACAAAAQKTREMQRNATSKTPVRPSGVPRTTFPHAPKRLRVLAERAAEAGDPGIAEAHFANTQGANAGGFDAGRCAGDARNFADCQPQKRRHHGYWWLWRGEPQAVATSLVPSLRAPWGTDALGVRSERRKEEDKKKAKTIVRLGIDPSPTRCSGDRPAQPRTGGSIDQGASPARGALSSFLSIVIPCDRPPLPDWTRCRPALRVAQRSAQRLAFI
jgi:hypothetical protein